MNKAEIECFEILLTIDKNIIHQQNISNYNIEVVILNSESSSIKALSKFIPAFLKNIESFETGEFYIIDI